MLFVRRITLTTVITAIQFLLSIPGVAFAWTQPPSNHPVNEMVPNQVSRRKVLLQHLFGFGGIATTTLLMPPSSYPASARLESVDQPNLLPTEKGLNVIQTEKFLTSGQAKRMDQLLSALERDTGWRVRVLCQAYPNTPGLAIRDYWDLGKEGQKDDKYVVLVVDQFGGKGNVLNFNVGDGTKFALPNVFWTRLQATYGNTFYVRDNGIDLAITNAIEAIVTCLRSEDQYCVSVPSEAPSLKSLGMM
jgi:TPM domain